jgi:hypothetical protein
MNKSELSTRLTCSLSVAADFGLLLVHGFISRLISSKNEKEPKIPHNETLLKYTFLFHLFKFVCELRNDGSEATIFWCPMRRYDGDTH